jgi:hypothetical protein
MRICLAGERARLLWLPVPEVEQGRAKARFEEHAPSAGDNFAGVGRTLEAKSEACA